jgi:phospholipase C
MCRLTACCALVLVSSLSLTACAGGGTGSGLSPSTANVAQSSIAESFSHSNGHDMRALLHARVKHVFVLIQENHTFDQYFGLFPGVNGQTVENLGTATAQATDCQPDPQTGGCQRPFLISANPNSPNYVADAPDITGGNNDRNDQEAGIDHGKMDGFLRDVEGGALPLGPSPSPPQIESHNESIGIEAVYDCDTVPYLWYYAKNFTLYDHYFQANTGQSTPGNIQLFAGQIGQTEAAAGEGVLSMPVAGGGYSDGVPISNDDNPPASQVPYVTTAYTPDGATFQSYATMPVLLDPILDKEALKTGVVGLIEDDIALESKARHESIPWSWYEEGLDTPNAGFSAHHTAPLYFDYINHVSSPYANATTLRDNTQQNGLISDIRNGKLPDSGVFWVKGGNENTYGLHPADPIFTNNSKGKVYYAGDDDHPGSGSSDHQVAEAYLAEVIDAIAASKYWKDSVIIVTWDDSGGFYDHVPPPGFGNTCPQDRTGPEAGYPCGDGVRLPAIVISPFSKTGAVVHDLADHGSVSKFIEEVFGLRTFASLPDEARGVAAGLAPADADPATSDLTDALDVEKLRLKGTENPPSLAIIPNPGIPPHMSCASLGIKPIAAPALLPSGFETAGRYLHEQLDGAANVVPLARRNDDDD